MPREPILCVLFFVVQFLQVCFLLFFVSGPARLILTEKERITMEDLKNEPFIVLSPSDNASYFERIYLLCARHGFQPQISNFMPSFRSMIATLIQNQTGVVISNHFISDANHPELRYYELQGTNAGMIIGWKKKNPNKYVQKLVDLFPACTAEDLL